MPIQFRPLQLGSPNSSGESLKASLEKINQNFAELFPAVIDIDPSNLDFSNFTDDIIPSVNAAKDLGSPSKQWRSLYVSGNSIHIGGTTLSVDQNGSLLVGGDPLPIEYEDLINKPEFADVAITGNYNDLINKPIIPSVDGYATESYVNSQITTVVGAAPAALNTLAELASALNNDQSYASTITTQLSLKANISSLSTVATSGSYLDLTNRPVLFSGSYNDLTNKPSLFSGNYNDLTNKPSLFSGNYNDLTNKPAIPSNLDSLTDVIITTPTLGQVLKFNGTNWINSVDSGILTVAWADVTGKPVFATVATSGSYNDLTNQPLLFSGNYSDLTNKPTIPTKTSDLTNDSGFLTSLNLLSINSLSDVDTVTTPPQVNQVLKWNGTNWVPAADATSGGGGLDADTLDGQDSTYYLNYTNLTNTPTIPSNLDSLTDVIITNPVLNEVLKFNGTNWVNGTDAGINTVAWADVTGKPAFSTVATSGSYDDLTNKPTLPTKTSDLTNDSGFINSITSFSVNSLSDVDTVTTPLAVNQVLKWNGTNWVNSVDSGLTTVAWSDVTDKPAFSTVATSGSYNDLSGTPNLSSYITLTNLSLTSQTASGGGSLSYNNSNGAFTFTPPDLSSYLTSSSLTGYATESYVTTAISNLVDAAPTTLNTLNELAAALGDDANFATTVTTALSGKAPSSGATLTNVVSMNFASGETVNKFSSDGAFVANSNANVPTEAAVKTFVDTSIDTALGNLTISGNTIGVNNANPLTISTNVTINGSLSSQASGTPEIVSDNEILLDAGTRVELVGSPLKMANLSTTQRNALIAENGDVIYNSTTNKFQGYANGIWVDLH